MRAMWIIAMLFLFLSEALVVLRLINRNGKIPAVFVILVLLLPTLVGRVKERRVKARLGGKGAADAGLTQRPATIVFIANLATFVGLLVSVILSGNDVISDELFNLIAAILATIICIASLILMPTVQE